MEKRGGCLFFILNVLQKPYGQKWDKRRGRYLSYNESLLEEGEEDPDSEQVDDPYYASDSEE